MDRLPGPKRPYPNRVPGEIESAILDHALAHPCHGALRVERALRLRGIQGSAGGGRGVRQRHGLLTKHERLLRLEKATAQPITQKASDLTPIVRTAVDIDRCYVRLIDVPLESRERKSCQYRAWQRIVRQQIELLERGFRALLKLVGGIAGDPCSH